MSSSPAPKKGQHWRLGQVFLGTLILTLYVLGVLLLSSPFLKSMLINHRSSAYEYHINAALPKGIKPAEAIQPPDFQSVLTATEPAREEVIGELKIESVSLQSPIFASVTNQHLLFGAAMMHHNRNPDIDNLVVIGHYLGYAGQLFSPLKDVARGDNIELIYLGERFRYQVVDKKIIDESEIEVLDNTTDDQGILTLITCDKPGATTNRLLVRGELVHSLPSEGNDSQGEVVPESQLTRKAQWDWRSYVPLYGLVVC